MSQSKAHLEKIRRYAALQAARPDARFLVQLLAGQAGLLGASKNKTAPEMGAAAYFAMGSDFVTRAPRDAESLDRAA